MAEVQIKSVGWWHERFADWLIANPHLKLKDAAREFDCTVPWLSVVKNSDAFKEVFAQRSRSVTDGVVNGTVSHIAGVREKTETMTEIALDALNEKLERECAADMVPRTELVEIVDKGMARLGYGANKQSLPPPVSIIANKVAIVSREALSSARSKILRVAEPNQTELDVKALGHELVPTDDT